MKKPQQFHFIAPLQLNMFSLSKDIPLRVVSSNDLNNDHSMGAGNRLPTGRKGKMKFAMFRTKVKNDQMPEQLFQEWGFGPLFADFVSLCW